MRKKAFTKNQILALIKGVIMFIGHYKSVNSAYEFYSEARDSLQFPTQVVYKGERYLFTKSINIPSLSHKESFIKIAQSRGVEFNVEID